MVTQNTLQVEEYISQVTIELKSLDLVKHDWGHVLASAPVAIGILGECMIVASMRKASLVQLEGPGLAPSLPANIMKVAQIGTTTFVEVHTRMNKMAMYAENIGRKGGTVDRIIDRIEGKDSPAARRMLTRQLARLESAATVCMNEASEVGKDFSKWQEFTNSLLFAMSIREDAAVVEHEEKNEKLKQEKLVRDVKAKELAYAEQILQEKEEQLFKGQKILESQSTRVNIASGLSTLSPILGCSLLAGTVFEIILAEYGVQLAREYREKQQKAVEEAEIETQKLQFSLKKIYEETSTLKEVRDVLFEAMKRLQTLQTEITSLLVFFKNIAGRVQFLVQELTTDFIENIDEECQASHTYEESLQNDIRATALPIKTQCMVIYQIAQVYSEVSFTYILDGLSLVNMLGLSHDSTSVSDIAVKQHKLDRYKLLAVEGVRTLTQRKRSEMNEGLRELVHNSSRREGHSPR